MSFPKRTMNLAGSPSNLYGSVNEIRGGPHEQECSEDGSGSDFQGPCKSSALECGCFRRHVVRSGGAAHRPEAPPRPVRIPAAESGAAQATLSSRTNVFWIGGSSQNTKRGFGGGSFHGTRSHGRDTHAEWNQSPAPRKLAAKANGAWTALRGCPCLAPDL